MSEYVTEYEWRGSGNLPPPNGRAGSNNGLWADAKSFYLSNTNLPGNDFGPYIQQLKPGDTVRVQQKSDPGIWCLWTLDIAPVSYASYFTLPGHMTEEHGAPTAALPYTVTLTSGVVQIRKVVQMSSAGALTGTGFWFAIYAYCNDETFWTMGHDEIWRPLPSLPQPGDHPEPHNVKNPPP